MQQSAGAVFCVKGKAGRRAVQMARKPLPMVSLELTMVMKAPGIRPADVIAQGDSFAPVQHRGDDLLVPARKGAVGRIYGSAAVQRAMMNSLILSGWRDTMVTFLRTLMPSMTPSTTKALASRPARSTGLCARRTARRQTARCRNPKRAAPCRSPDSCIWKGSWQ